MKTHIEFVERFDGYTHGSFINKLFWIAGSFESSEFKEFLRDIQKEDFEHCLPEIAKSKYFEDYQSDDEIEQALIDFNYFGLIAEVHHPKCHDFRFDENGEVKSCSISGWSCRISYVYAETLDDLMKNIEKASERVYNEYISAEKKI